MARARTFYPYFDGVMVNVCQPNREHKVSGLFCIDIVLRKKELMTRLCLVCPFKIPGKVYSDKH